MYVTCEVVEVFACNSYAQLHDELRQQTSVKNTHQPTHGVCFRISSSRLGANVASFCWFPRLAGCKLQNGPDIWFTSFVFCVKHEIFSISTGTIKFMKGKTLEDKTVIFRSFKVRKLFHGNISQQMNIAKREHHFFRGSSSTLHSFGSWPSRNKMVLQNGGDEFLGLTLMCCPRTWQL